MYSILICSAFPKEISIIKKKVKQFNLPLKVNFLQLWLWNYNAIFSLTKYLENNKPDFVVNIWIAWIRDKAENLKSFYQVSNILEYETNKELIVPVFFKFWEFLTCISANKPIKNVDVNFPVLLDMESFWFEFVMEKYNLPRLILKVPVDKSESELKNIDFDLAVKNLENIDYKVLLLEIQKFLNKFNQKDSLEKYMFLPFSVSEIEIFRFLAKKYIFKKWDFDKFFYEFLDKNQNLPDKQKVKKIIYELRRLLD